MTNHLQRTTAQKLAQAKDQVARLRTLLVSESRRADAHRKIKLGGLVIAAGADGFADEALLVGMLLDARNRLRSSDYRNEVREAGFQHLAARKQAQQISRGN